MSGRLPDRGLGLPLVSQAWRDVLFVSWSYDPPVIAGLLPPGLEVDTFDGSAWVSIVALVNAEVRPALLPARRGLRFAQTNLRTYVRRPGGRDGLWLFSMDVPSRVLTALGRGVLGAPYVPADVRVGGAGGSRTYEGMRGGRRTYDIGVRVGPAVAATPFDDWLTGRWGLFLRHAGVLLEAPARHEPWPLHTVEVVRLREELTAAAGLPSPAGEPVLQFSPGVEAVRLGLVRPLR